MDAPTAPAGLTMNRYGPFEVTSGRESVTTKNGSAESTQDYKKVSITAPPDLSGMLVSTVKSVPDLLLGAGSIVSGSCMKGCGQVFCGVTCCAASSYVGHVACERTGIGAQKGDDGSVMVSVDFKMRSPSEMLGQIKDDGKYLKAMLMAMALTLGLSPRTS